ncbi:sulfotransferase domain-containing protein [Croceicoccus sp. Ery15]|uniref:sulfotransferase domain-containing protein n=1 Tax=Croceicoccus sp. Ery15 TaxID=1703338 RepID=UPI001E2F6BE5|nr:sulfotransferase domain-containing protein [Croceicoccus sp. Ery15]
METRNWPPAGNREPTIVVYADLQSLEALTGIAARGGDILAQLFDYAILDGSDDTWAHALPTSTKRVSLEDLGRTLPSDSVFLVGGPLVSKRIDQLALAGYAHVYNLNEIAREMSAKLRLLVALAPGFAGSRVPAMLDPVGQTEPHHTLIEPHHLPLPSRLVFLVNSLPKSGSVWLCGMLEHVLDVSGSDRVRISHCADLVFDQNQPNLGGAVSLVRDMRDVVVSWFYDVAASDLRTGFERARYPDIASFYFECFVGLIGKSDRYFSGDLVGWIDRNCANYCPLIRYEDMVADPQRALTKVLNAWRIRVPEARVAAAVRAFEPFRLRKAGGPRDGYVGKMYRRGHLRNPGSGNWQNELPAEVLSDIERRFADYQQRLGYA